MLLHTIAAFLGISLSTTRRKQPPLCAMPLQTFDLVLSHRLAPVHLLALRGACRQFRKHITVEIVRTAIRQLARPHPLSGIRVRLHTLLGTHALDFTPVAASMRGNSGAAGIYLVRINGRGPVLTGVASACYTARLGEVVQKRGYPALYVRSAFYQAGPNSRVWISDIRRGMPGDDNTIVMVRLSFVGVGPLGVDVGHVDFHIFDDYMYCLGFGSR